MNFEKEKVRISEYNIKAYNDITNRFILVRDSDKWIPPKKYEGKGIN